MISQFGIGKSLMPSGSKPLPEPMVTKGHDIILCHQTIVTENIYEWISAKNATVETLYSTIYYSKYFIELNFDKSTQYVAFWTHKRHPIARPFGRAMECLLWVLQQKLTVL